MDGINYELVDMLTAELSICRDELERKRGKVGMDEERELRRRVGETIGRLNKSLTPGPDLTPSPSNHPPAPSNHPPGPLKSPPGPLFEGKRGR